MDRPKHVLTGWTRWAFLGLLALAVPCRGEMDTQAVLEGGLRMARSLTAAGLVSVPVALVVPGQVPVVGGTVTRGAAFSATRIQRELDGIFEQEEVPKKIRSYAKLMIQVIDSDPESRRELGHLVVTLQRFMKDGRALTFEKDPGGWAVTKGGESDQPTEIAFNTEMAEVHPLFGASTLAHELQHVYDQYHSRRYVLDSEARGYKASAILMKAAAKNFASMLAEIEAGHKSKAQDRNILREERRMMVLHAQGNPQAFVEAVKYGNRYTDGWEGFLTTRLSLKEAVAPDSELRRRLGHRRSEAVRLETELKQGKEALAKLQEEWDKKGTRKLEIQVQQKIEDVAGMEARTIALRTMNTFAEMRLRRMEREWAWLKKKDPKADYDLYLTADADLAGDK